MKRSTGAKSQLGQFDAKTATRLIEASNDVALVLDGGGTILDVLTQDSELAKRATRDWVGKGWAQTVTVESREKVAAILRDAQARVDEVTAAAAAEGARWRHVNHPTKGGEDLPMLYSALRVVDDGRTPASGRIVAFGRDLSTTLALQRRLVEAQQAMERDYWRFREAETRYRSLFQGSAEAVLIVDGLTQKVLEANPAAMDLCNAAKTKLVGAALQTLFDRAGAEALQGMLAAARTIGKRDAVPATLSASGARVNVSATVFRQEKGAFVLVRLVPVLSDNRRGRAGAHAASVLPARDVLGEPLMAVSLLQSFVENSPDALAFCDVHGKVLSVNRAFSTLAQLSAEDQARGRPLDRWLGRTGVELGVLMSNLRQRGSVGLFVTELRGELGARSEVEISASVLSSNDGPAYAFAVRDIGRRLQVEDRGLAKVPRSVGQLTELVGRVPLKDIVSETTDLIEQLSIETALQMTSDNRASAAQLLGLSRQSLYVKLRRFGMGDLGGDAD